MVQPLLFNFIPYFRQLTSNYYYSMTDKQIQLKKLIWQVPAFILLLIVMGNVLMLILFSDFKFTGHLFLIASVNSVLVGGIFAIVIGSMVSILDKKLPWLNFPLRRMIVQVVLTIVIVMAIIMVTIPMLGMFWNQEINSEVFLSQMFFMMKIVFPFLFVGTLLTNAIFFFKNWKEAAVQQEKLKREQLALQYETLKSQVNPHFLFNSLNNIDILIEESPKRASEYLKKLSDILRYVLYETGGETDLAKEMTQIRSYIDLQKIRTDNQHYINLKIKGELKDQKIAPMIFLPFIENAFKHSKNKTIENAIDIEFDIQCKKVKMICRNYFEPNHKELIKNEGLGIETIKQRLNLLYPHKYSEIICREGFF